MAGCPEMAGATVVDGDGATGRMAAELPSQARAGGGGARVWRGVGPGARAASGGGAASGE
jgi:hypothetical protein